MLNKLLIFITLFGITMYNVSVSESQEIDDKFIPFLPTESEIPGYTYIRQMNFIWQVEKGVTQDIVRQFWNTINDTDEVEDLSIDVCIFDTIPEAIAKTSYSKGTYAVPYEWGSVSGSIDGDHSWYASYSKTPAQYIVRGNVGIRINEFLTAQEYIDFADVVNVMVSKIEKNLNKDVLMSEQESKKKQIAISKYRQLTDPVLALNETKEFTVLKQWDSKWVIDENSFATGIRTEWKNEQGAIIGIDICEFETSDAARSAMELQAFYTRSKIFDMEDMTTFDTHIDRWRKIITPYKYFNSVSVYDKLAVHIYQYDPEKKPDTKIFSNVAYKLVDQVTF